MTSILSAACLRSELCHQMLLQSACFLLQPEPQILLLTCSTVRETVLWMREATGYDIVASDTECVLGACIQTCQLLRIQHQVSTFLYS